MFLRNLLLPSRYLRDGSLLYIVVCLDFNTQNVYTKIVKLCMFGRLLLWLKMLETNTVTRVLQN